MRPVIDHGKTINWSATSGEYAVFRPGPPDDLYTYLQALGIGVEGQRILDLGTGTGVLARAFARRGCKVAGIDLSSEQISEALRLAAAERLTIDFRVAPAEEPPFREHSFDVATANQCFLYFDKERTIAALRRALVRGGRLVISHFNWLPQIDAIAGATEQLILKFNPSWQGAGFDGNVVPVPNWMPNDLALEGSFFFDVDVPFDQSTWRGRIRASRGVGPSMPPDRVDEFDLEHAALLKRCAPEHFTIKHRVDASILRLP